MHLQPRGTYHSPSIDRHLFEMRAPHMDFELVDFLLTIPPYSRLEQRVYKKMIAFRFPKIRDIPCTNSGLPINPKFFREYTAMVARHLGKKAVGPMWTLLHKEPPLGRDPRSLAEDFRAEPALADKVLRPLLRVGVFPAAIFDHTSIDNIITEHYQRRGNHEAILSNLISFGLAVKFFLHDDLTEVPTYMYTP
jgi:asparagine synthetase B (glutamine-hydrolysing)